MLKDRLKEARLKAKMTQKEVANRLGITESTYCGYETGKRQPDALKIAAIASILGVSGDFLLETGYDETKIEPATHEGSELSAGEERVITLLRLVPGDRQDEAYNAIESVLRLMLH